MPHGSRPERVGDLIRQELSVLLTRHVRDPGVRRVTVTHVRVSKDLQQARVYYTGPDDVDARRTAERALSRVRPYVKRELARRVRLRHTPELQFSYDDSADRQDRIAQIFDEIADEPRKHPTHALGDVIEAVAARQRFVLASHARPDGDSIGSELALAFGLRALGKDVRVVNRDPAPSYLQSFPGITDIEVAESVDGSFDAAIVLECGSLGRTEVAGLERYFVINIDHHVGNTTYGDLNWIDETAAACGEMVFDLIEGLGVPLSREMATHVYVAILTDTGAFHHSNITDRTFEICRRVVLAGVAPANIAGQVYQRSSVGKLKLTGHILDTMELVDDGRVALLRVDDEVLRTTECAADDIEGLINMPLSARHVRAVVMFKRIDGQERVSLRSKGNVDVRAVASRHGGGGHPNAAGFSLEDSSSERQQAVVDEVVVAVGSAPDVDAPSDSTD